MNYTGIMNYKESIRMKQFEILRQVMKKERLEYALFTGYSEIKVNSEDRNSK